MSQVGGLIGKGNNASAGVDRAIQIWGLWHYAQTSMGLGTTVSVSIIGQDCGDFTVAADGSVTVPLSGFTLGGGVGVVTMANLLASDGLFTALEQNCPISILNGGPRLFINVPVVIGSQYVSQGQRLRAIAAADLQEPGGSAVGLYRRTDQFAALVQDAVVASFGTSLTPTPNGNMLSQQFYAGGTFGGSDPNSATLAFNQGFTGVIRQTLVATQDFDDMFCWQVDRPWPLVVNAVTCFLEAENK